MTSNSLFIVLCTYIHLPVTAVGPNPDSDLRFFRSYPAGLRNVGGSTRVPARA